MAALRLASNTSRRMIVSRTSLGRRGYAEATSDKINLSLVLPWKVRSGNVIITFRYLQELN